MDEPGHGPLIHGDGTSEAIWQRSGELQGVPLLAAAALASNHDRVVIVSPHPDDEILGVGGTMTQLSLQGVPILVVAVTDGEASHAGLDPAQLAQTRNAERLCALRALDVLDCKLVRLAFPDGAVAAHSAALSAFLRAALKRRDLVFCPWRSDGHPDHEATAMATIAATAQIGCLVLEFPIWGWHWASPLDIPWRYALKVPMSEEIWRRKCVALDHFVSQIDPRNGEAILSQATLARFRRTFEVFFGQLR